MILFALEQLRYMSKGIEGFDLLKRIFISFFDKKTIFSQSSLTEKEWSWLQSTYFAFVTLTTVGYGDFLPTNDNAKIFTCFYVLLSTTLLVAGFGVLAGWVMEKTQMAEIKRSIKYMIE